ncbi:hypothetical protein B0T22DRAFT_435370 [Podospora appendiculata]|uniref:Uncharacterized protein n=1 Tax=Podospora appendiculata TaxID=314037 RepID=A0AAE0XEM1_9PEZI|nr:hypothetical protein B0T22DRAFT_435370 [Podospora appendiculata]
MSLSLSLSLSQLPRCRFCAFGLGTFCTTLGIIHKLALGITTKGAYKKGDQGTRGVPTDDRGARVGGSGILNSAEGSRLLITVQGVLLEGRLWKPYGLPIEPLSQSPIPICSIVQPQLHRARCLHFECQSRTTHHRPT